LDEFKLPWDRRDRLIPQMRLKRGITDGTAALRLEMNRSDLPDEELRRTKSDALALLKAAK